MNISKIIVGLVASAFIGSAFAMPQPKEDGQVGAMAGKSGPVGGHEGRNPAGPSIGGHEGPHGKPGHKGPRD